MNVKPMVFLGHIHQNYYSGLQYQFVNDKLCAVHPGVFCKDLLNPIIWSEITNNSYELYGIYYKPGQLDIGGDKVKMALDYVDGKSNRMWSKETVNSISTVIHYVEDLLGIKRTEFSLRNKDYYLLLSFSTKWISQPFLLSLYSLLLRYSLTYKNGDIMEFIMKPTGLNNDAMYLKQVNKYLKYIFDGRECNQKWGDYRYDIICIQSGIVCMSDKYTWYEPKRVSI